MSRLLRYAAPWVALLAMSSSAFADGRDPINAYRVKATPKNIQKLAMAGYDVTEGRRGEFVEVYGTAGQLRKLRQSEGVRASKVKAAATTARRVKARAAAYTGSDAGFKVWRRYDRVAGDGKEQYLELYDRIGTRNIAKVVDVGDTHLGRDIVAVKVTGDAKTTADGSRPAVLYNAIQHAREWLAGETCRRSLLYFADNYGTDAQVTRLVNNNELWFMCIANPDGYEYTFTAGNRLWRKNMADNDGDGIRGENGDGVDPNRNFPVHWGLDDEGSSRIEASETYRGPSAASEPETQAMLGLFDRVDFAFQKNDHTAASLLLYPMGWQQYTWSDDDPIFTALAGTDKDPGINTFDPDLGAELYITNGDTNDTAYDDWGILSYTPEGTPAKDLSVSGFEYEDQDGAIEAEFNRHLPFVLDLAESAANPEAPVNHLKNKVADFYPDAFAESFGDPQPVQVLAKKSLGELVLHYRINGGDIVEKDAGEAPAGERYGAPGTYFHRVRGTVTGTSPGDNVEVWFAQKNGTKRSASFAYHATAETGNRVLVMSAEDYSGPTPAQDPSGPKYAASYVAALAANGIAADLYDVDAHGRRAPDPLGVLSHYDAVIWDTGDDYLTREPGQVPGTGTSRLAAEEEVAVRDYLNEGGKLVYLGKHAGQQYVEGFEFRNWGFPQPNESASKGKWCDATLPESKDGCIAHVDDFLQYYLGSGLRVENGASWLADGTVHDVSGEDPFGPATWSFANTAGDPGAGAPTATFGVLSSMIENPAYQDSTRLAGWDRPNAGPFSPFTGSWYMATGHDDEAYKRLSTTVNVPAGSTGTLTFRTSFDLEAGWDHLFVEAAPAGTDQWTTLPDANGHTLQATGDSCWTDGGWWQLHARLAHYQTVSGDACTPTGTTGAWNAATGSSGGWQEWEIDLAPYAGQGDVALAIVTATDWAVGGVGAFVDDATVTVGGAEQSSTSFEADTGTWATGPSPEGTPNPEPQWSRSTQVFQEGAVIGTPDTVYAGFEAATMNSAGERASFVKEAMEHLGVLGG